MEYINQGPVLELLRKQNIQYKVSGRDYLIQCLNPDHDDKNPSCRVDRTTGITHCFSCGFKTNIFTHFGILANHTSIKIEKLKQKLKDVKQGMLGVEFPERMVTITKSFRGISLNTLKEFGAFQTIESSELANRIWFPIKDITKKTVVFVGRHTLSSGKPKYLNYPSNVVLPIYPDFFKSPHTSAVLVEGIFDMLNLYDKGLTNVCCTFGTSTLFKNAESKLLGLKAQGISKIYIMYDGDKPGQDASNKLKPILEECGYLVEEIVLEEGTDPGELDQTYVDSIKAYINEKDSGS